MTMDNFTDPATKDSVESEIDSLGVDMGNTMLASALKEVIDATVPPAFVSTAFPVLLHGFDFMGVQILVVPGDVALQFESQIATVDGVSRPVVSTIYDTKGDFTTLRFSADAFPTKVPVVEVNVMVPVAPAIPDSDPIPKSLLSKIMGVLWPF